MSGEKMSKSTIYFDMDGVLADFVKGCRDILKLDFIDLNKDIPDDFMWNEMKNHSHYYLQLEPVYGTLELFRNTLKIYGAERVQILSAIPKPKRGIVNAASDKLLWVKKYLGDKVVVNLCQREEKQALAKGNILIDDYLINIEEWRKEGGLGIHFKSPAQAKGELEQLAPALN
jgi:5'(3')-deoxyribonucleotidase